jgi:FKBP-type peptidyl-prolyl cis-trans isomerase
MNIFNKYEAVGIFLSIGVMALALFLVRFDTGILAQNTGLEQTASVSNTLEERLTEAHGANGQMRDLVIEDVRIGSGDAVKEGDVVEVHYEGRLQDGTRFDSSYERGQTFTFTVGDGKVIEGWEEGILGMQVGGERVLVVPPGMAYGNRQVSIIPPNSTLVFMVELLDIR